MKACLFGRRGEMVQLWAWNPSQLSFCVWMTFFFLSSYELYTKRIIGFQISFLYYDRFLATFFAHEYFSFLIFSLVDYSGMAGWAGRGGNIYIGCSTGDTAQWKCKTLTLCAYTIIMYITYNNTWLLFGRRYFYFFVPPVASCWIPFHILPIVTDNKMLFHSCSFICWLLASMRRSSVRWKRATVRKRVWTLTPPTSSQHLRYSPADGPSSARPPNRTRRWRTDAHSPPDRIKQPLIVLPSNGERNEMA